MSALLKFILLAALFYYLLRIIGRLFTSSQKRSASSGINNKPQQHDSRYSHLTDQEIEDADYEEISKDN